MKFRLHTIFFTLLLFPALLAAQATFNKKGGVGFRVDDQQTAVKWRDFNRVFNKYGYHFSLGIDIIRVSFDTAGLNALKEVVASGNEIMDHTPYGSTNYMWVQNLADTNRFKGKPGVDHVNKNRICLMYDSIYTENLTGEGKVDLIGSKLISRDPGEFKSMYSPAYYALIYLPEKNLLCTWYNLENKNQNDPDTISLRTYWQETFVNDTASNLTHHRLSGYDVKMHPEALSLMMNFGRQMYDSLGLPRPRTWIQPGGSFSQLSAWEVKNKIGIPYGYNAAATYVNPSFKLFNEVDSLGIKKFSIQNPDINEESNYFQSLMTTIADNSAKHQVSLTLSHFLNPVGGWDAYIGRVDTLLAWCRDNDIPVRTIGQWASILFDSIPNPYVNVIPELQTDLNGNGVPDGMTGPFGTFDSTDGVARSHFKSISRTNSGNYFVVNIMGGVEKGWNRLSAYTKGMPGDSIRVSVAFNELPNSTKYYNLACNTSGWQEVSKLIYIDPRASRVTIQFNALKNNNPGAMKISGMQLRKESNLRIKQGFNHKVPSHGLIPSLASTQYVIDSCFSPLDYKMTILRNPAQLSVQFDTVTKVMQFIKPTLFWTGRDSLKVWAMNGDNKQDSGWIYIESVNPAICSGDSIWLSGDAEYGSGFSWDGQPSGIGFYAKPLSTTTYTLHYTNKQNQAATATVTVQVDQVKPEISLPSDTIICRYAPFTLTVPNNGTITWFDAMMKPIQKASSISFGPLYTPMTLYIENRINSCYTLKQLNIQVGPPKRLNLKVISDTTKMNQSKVVTIPLAQGLAGYLLNTPQNQFLYSDGDVVFNPQSDFTGKDSAQFHITDGACSHDTIWVRMIVKNTVSVKEAGKLKGINLYPNPARDYLYIESNGKLPLMIRITDLSGRDVLNSEITQGYEQINLHSLEKGIYMVTLTHNQESCSMMVVKD